jgi:hypothetical protein
MEAGTAWIGRPGLSITPPLDQPGADEGRACLAGVPMKQRMPELDRARGPEPPRAPGRELRQCVPRTIYLDAYLPGLFR